MILWAIQFIIAGQAVHYSVAGTVHVLDGEVKVGKVFHQ